MKQAHLARLAIARGRHCSLCLRSFNYKDRPHLPFAHVARSFSTACFTHAELHTLTGIISPLLALLAHSVLSTHCSLCSRRITYTCRQEPSALANIARSIQRSWQTLLVWLAHNHTCSETSSDQVSAKSLHKQLQKSTFYALVAPLCGQSWVPPGGGKLAITYPGHPPKYQPNQPTDS